MGDPKEREESERAHGIALQLLTHRSRSVAEMRARLLRRGLEEHVVDIEIARLLDSGLLDDSAFASEKAASLTRRGLGPRGLRARLSATGVGGEPAQSAMEEALEAAGGEDAMARQVVKRRYGDLSEAPHETRAKAARYLVRRGFSGSVAGAVCGIFSDESD